MACKLDYNKNNKPVRVYKENGEESELFKKVASHPLMGYFEESLNTYKNIFSNKMGKSESEYSFINKVDGKIMSSYKEALNTRKNIEVGFVDSEGKFFKVKEIKPSFDPTTQEGFINSEIVNETMSESRIVKNGEIYFRPFGSNVATEGITSDFIDRHALVNLGWQNYIKDGNGYRFGEQIKYDSEKLSDVDEVIQKEIGKIVKNANRDDGTDTNDTTLNENDLKLKLLDFLKDIGVDAMSISKYLNKYKAKNGNEPNAKALADISNKVVAFKNGEIELDALTEEVAHFIESGIPTAEKANALRNIHKTPEYQKHSDEYRNIYSSQFSGEELENAVRREVLGKVIANSIKNNFNTQNKSGVVINIINKVREFINKFINKIKVGNTNELEDLTNKVNDLFYSNQLASILNTDSFKKQDNVFFNMDNEDASTKKLRTNLLISLKDTINNIRNLNKGNVKSISDFRKVDRLIKKLDHEESKLDDLQLKHTLSELLSVASSQSNLIQNVIKDSKKHNKIAFGSIESAALDSLSNRISPTLGMIKENIKSDKSKLTRDPNATNKAAEKNRVEGWKNLLDKIDTVQRNINNTQSKASTVYDGVIEDISDRIARKYGLGDEYKEHIQEWLNSANRDISVYQRYFGQLNQSSNPLLGMLSEVWERTSLGSNRESLFQIKKLQRGLDKLGLSYKELDKLKDGSYLVDETDWNSLEEFMTEERIKIRLSVEGKDINEDNIEEYKEKQSNNELPTLSEEQWVDYNQRVQELKEKYQEKYFKEEYYKEKRDRYERLGISIDTQNRIKNYSRDRNSLMSGAIDDAGNTDWSLLSESEKAQLETIKNDRADDKSFVDDYGVLKEGLDRTLSETEARDKSFNEETGKHDYVEYKGVYYYINRDSGAKNVDSSAIISIDLHKLDNDFMERANLQRAEDRMAIRKEVTNDSRSVEELVKLSENDNLEPLTGSQLDEFRLKAKRINLEKNKRFIKEALLIENGISENSPEYKSLEDAMKNISSDFDGFKVDGKDYIYDSNLNKGYREVGDRQGRDAARAFVMSNSKITFNNAFYEDISVGDSFITKAEKDVRENSDLTPETRNKAKEHISRVKKINADIRSLMSKYKNANKTYETDVYRMTRQTKEKIKSLDNDRMSEYREIEKLLELEDAVFSDQAVNEPNESFYRDLEDESIGTYESDKEFILSVLGENSKKAVKNFERKLEELAKGNPKVSMSKPQTDVAMKYLPMGVDKAVIEYAKKMLPYYYKRFVPKEFEVAINPDNFSSESDYLDYVFNSKYINLNPNMSFVENDMGDIKNPNFDPEYKGGMQVKKQYFRSKKYKDLFAPDKEGNPTKNKKLFDGLQLLKEAQEWSLKNYDVHGSHNIYLLPQIHRRGVDRVKSASKGNIKEALDNVFTYQADDKEYGDKFRDTDTYLPPKYYLDKIENQSDLSTDVVMTYALMMKESSLYKHRMNNLAEANAILQKLKSQESDPNRKADVKNAVSMAKDWMDFAFFGKMESKQWKINIAGRQIDITKMARLLLQFVKFRNLGFSPFVAATSYFNSEVQARVEKHVGEYLNESAMRLGTKRFMKKGMGGAAEVGKSYKTSEVNVSMETLGIKDIADSMVDAKSSRATRLLKGLGWGIHEAFDYPVTPRVMYGVLYDHRFINGSIMNFNEFRIKQKMDNNDISYKDIKSKWDKTSEKAVINYMNTEEGVLKFNDGVLNDKNLLSDEHRNNAYLEDNMDVISTRAKAAVSHIQQLLTPNQRVTAQRHFALNYLMTHRSWLSVVISARTKRPHFNTSTGNYEEGSYRSFYNFIASYANSLRKGGKTFEAIKTVWKGDDLLSNKLYSDDGVTLNKRGLQERQLRRRGIRRVSIDTSYLLALGGLVFSLGLLADDDEDNKGLQFASYIMERTMVQLGSSQTALPLGVWDAIKQPFVGLGVVKDLAMLPIALFNNETVKSGLYAGETQRSKALKQIVPGYRMVNNFEKLDQTRSTYWHFNKSSYYSTPAALYELIGTHEAKGGELHVSVD